MHCTLCIEGFTHGMFMIQVMAREYLTIVPITDKSLTHVDQASKYMTRMSLC